MQVNLALLVHTRSNHHPKSDGEREKREGGREKGEERERGVESFHEESSASLDLSLFLQLKKIIIICRGVTTRSVFFHFHFWHQTWRWRAIESEARLCHVTGMWDCAGRKRSIPDRWMARSRGGGCDQNSSLGASPWENCLCQVLP